METSATIYMHDEPALFSVMFCFFEAAMLARYTHALLAVVSLSLSRDSAFILHPDWQSEAPVHRCVRQTSVSNVTNVCLYIRPQNLCLMCLIIN